jgi:hypothetical protein
MSAELRAAVFCVFGALWLSGCAWLVLHYGFAHPSEFGLLPHPWEAPLLHLHGWLAVAAVFLLGWIMAQHVADRWPQSLRRFSGITVAAFAVVLGLSGYALYYSIDGPHAVASRVHEILGVIAIMSGLVHWRRLRTADAATRESTRQAAL